MAVQLPIPVRFEDVFPEGAFALGVDPINNFDRQVAKEPDPQERDKTTGERMWAVRVLDGDPTSRKGQAEMVVKIAAPAQPVPPDVLPGTPFRPVEFDGMEVMPYVDTNRAKPRLAFSLRAKSMRAPSAAKIARSAAGAA
jgi:hypothetical protein